MSGSTGLRSAGVRISVEGADAAEAAFKRVGEAGDQGLGKVAAASGRATAALREVQPAADRAAAAVASTQQQGSRLDSAAERLPQLVNEVAGKLNGIAGINGQIANETARTLNSVAQQAPAFLTAFGPGGAIAGAVIAAGALAAGLLIGAEAASKLREALDAVATNYRQAGEQAERYRTGQQAEIENIARLRTFYEQLSEAQRQAEAGRLTRQTEDLARAASATRDQLTASLSGRLAFAENPLSGFGPEDAALSVVPGPARLPAGITEATVALREFLNQENLTAEGAAQLGLRLREIEQQFPAAAAEVRRLREALENARPQIIEVEQAQQRAAAQADALRRSTEGAAGGIASMAAAAQRTLGALGAMGDALNAADQRARDAGASLAAFQRGGLAALQTEQTRQRAEELTRQGRDRDIALLQSRGGLSAEDAALQADSLDRVRERRTQAEIAAGLEAQAARDRERLAQLQRPPAAERAPPAERVDPAIAEAQRLFDGSRNAAERYEATLIRLGELRPTLEGLFGPEGADQVISRQADTALELLRRASETTAQVSQEAKQIGNALGEAFDSAVFKGTKFSDVLKKLEQDLLRIGTRALISKPLEGAFNSLLSSATAGGGDKGGGEAGGGLGGLISSGFSALSSFFTSAPVLHDGGLVGAGGSMRSLPASMFFGAPRYHSGGIAGLAPDERPAILQTGERVLSRDQVRRGGVGSSVVFNIQTADAGSFQQSQAGIAAKMQRSLARAQRNV